jgi:hypothetical protein
MPPKLEDCDDEGANRMEHFRHMQEALHRDEGKYGITTYKNCVDVQVNTDVLLLLHSTLATAAL